MTTKGSCDVKIDWRVLTDRNVTCSARLSLLPLSPLNTKITSMSSLRRASTSEHRIARKKATTAAKASWIVCLVYDLFADSQNAATCEKRMGFFAVLRRFIRAPMFRRSCCTRSSEKTRSNTAMPSTARREARDKQSTSPAAVAGRTGDPQNDGMSAPTGGQQRTTTNATARRQSTAAAPMPTNAKNAFQRATAPLIFAAEETGTRAPSSAATSRSGRRRSGCSQVGRSIGASGRRPDSTPTRPDAVASSVPDTRDPPQVATAGTGLDGGPVYVVAAVVPPAVIGGKGGRRELERTNDGRASCSV